MVPNSLEEGASYPLITVVIATYNYGRYIRTAIESVLKQTYPSTELIVIDDGSTDDTAITVSAFPDVQYFYHKNRGVSASRNAGISRSKGRYILFLDADDWLENTAIEDNYNVLKNLPTTAFVSANYRLLRADTNRLEEVVTGITANAYTELLKRNYIGMLAAVLFQRWVFSELQFDESIRACEDYDLYLNVARKYPVVHQQKFIATYFFHSSSLSHRYQLMIESIQRVIKKQFDCLKNEEEYQAYLSGLDQWTEYQTLATNDVGKIYGLGHTMNKPAFK